MGEFVPISVLMPVKNGEKFLPAALKYLANNCSPKDEIIFVNDNSTDNTLKILQLFAKGSQNILIAENSNPGLVNALNLGLSLATNEWVARFDVDDQYPASRIDLTRKNINEDVVGIFSDYQFISNRGKNLGSMPSAISKSLTYLSLASSQRTAHPSVCFNKAAVQAVGGYLQEDFPAEDISLWLRLTKVGNIKSIPETLLHYRLNPKSISSTMRAKSISKKSELLSKYIFNEKLVLQSLSTLDETKLFYSNYAKGQERYLLHLRDLLLILKLNSSNNKISLNFIYKKIFLDLNNLIPGQNLFREMLLRRLYRSI